MVRIGDTIKTNDGVKGEVTNILFDERKKRFVICFKSEELLTYFIEGDKNFKVIKKGKEI